LLAGTGILGLKLFTGKKNDTRELAKRETVVPLQKDSSRSSTAIASKKETAAVQKNMLLANNNRPTPSLKRRTAVENLASLDKKSSLTIAALSAKQQAYSKMTMTKDTVLPDKLSARDMAALTTLGGTSAGSPSQLNSAREINRYSTKPFDPALTATTNVNSILLKGATIDGSIISFGKGKKTKGDTINLDRSEMSVFSQAGYLKPGDSAFTSLSNVTSLGKLSTLTVAGSVFAGKRGITIDTFMLADQKKSHIALSDISTPSSASPRFDLSKPKKDMESTLDEIVVTRNSNERSSKKELSRSANAGPEYKAEKEIANSRGSIVSVNPTGGWYSFTKYLTAKIATTTGIKRDISEHGTVEIKMNISESGKVSKVTILNSFNTQLNPILIKAIRKGPRWSSSDYLEKKGFVFKVEL
jgi:hypothetical protein